MTPYTNNGRGIEREASIPPRKYQYYVVILDKFNDLIQ